MILEDHERIKFAAYCRQVAEDTKAIMEQRNKLNLPQHVLAEINKREKMRAAGYMIVAADLENTDSFTIGPQTTGDK